MTALASVRAAVQALPAGLPRPVFRPAGTLADAGGGTRGPGLYLIGLPGARGYHGMATDLAARLLQHRRGAERLGFATATRPVWVAPLAVAPAALRDVERRINAWLRQHRGPMFSNLRTELEAGAPTEENEMHTLTCRCPQCRAGGEFELLGPGGTAEAAAPLDESAEYELALELMGVASEEELDQFLGKLVRRAGAALGRIAKPLGGVLRGVAKAALPFVGGALGSMIPIPGVGTMIGRAAGQALSSALEAELGELAGEARDLEMARRFVRMADGAARMLAQAPAAADPHAAARDAVLAAARRRLPAARPAPAAAGRWQRHGRQIVLHGA